MLRLAFLLIAATAVSAQLIPYTEDLPSIDYPNEWAQYKQRCHVAPTTTGEATRHYNNFITNIRYAAEHNTITRSGEQSGSRPQNSERLGTNCESHFSHEEWRQHRGFTHRDAWLAAHPEPAPPAHAIVRTYEVPRSSSQTMKARLRASMAGSPRGGSMTTQSKTCSSSTRSCDWRTKTGVVGPVQNQDQCGSCWAFSATEVVRSCNVIARGPNSMPNLSAEQVLDCSQAEGNVYNCSEGYVAGGMQYVIDNGGINDDIAYPYVAGNGINQVCNTSLTSRHVATATQVRYVYQNSPSSMISCAYNQPIAVNLAGGAPIFQLYVSGIISNATACGTVVDHSVLLVGWGTSGSTPYWTVRNQYGTGWGISGDAMILRDTTDGGIGMCAINSYPTFTYC